MAFTRNDFGGTYGVLPDNGSISNGVLVLLQCSQRDVNNGSGILRLMSKYAEHIIKGCLFRSTLMVVMSGEQN